METETFLDVLAEKYGTDKRIAESLHGYTTTYYNFLKYKRFEYENVLEIGVENGASHKMWYDFFPNAVIYGIDDFSSKNIYTSKEDIENDRIKIFIGKQEDKNFLDNTFNNIMFDMIIDDGSHFSTHQQKSFDYLWDKLKPNGYYCIEDLGEYTVRKYREFDDIRSSTVIWLFSLIMRYPFSYFIAKERLNKMVHEIKEITIIGAELGIIIKK
jgi:SAM-dependent methyltransferase